MEPQLREVLAQWDGKGTFYDPFVGSGFVSGLVREMHPNAPQVLGDVNPWLVGFLRRQLEGSPTDPIPEPGLSDVPYWRNLHDPALHDTNTQAARFLVCLLTSWGARYQDGKDGKFALPIQTEQGRYNQAVSTLPELWQTFWLRKGDLVLAQSWFKTVVSATQPDLIFLDPPYTETMGYGVKWSVKDQIEVLLWAADKVKEGHNVVVSNHGELKTIYERFGMHTLECSPPARGKTSQIRSEILAFPKQLTPYAPLSGFLDL